MNDAELSLAVAKILWPEYEWFKSNVRGAYRKSGMIIRFTHTTDDALGKMCKWLAKDNAGIDDYEEWLAKALSLADMLGEDNPHRAIAEAIVEVA